MLFALFFYILLMIATLAWVCMPTLRDRAAALAHGLWFRGRWMGSRWRATGARHARRGSGVAQDAVQLLLAEMRRRVFPLSAAFAVIALLPLMAGLLRDTFRVESFDPNMAHAVDQRVAGLLQGEQLVAPTPLPPELFVTTEVEDWQPLARSASRQWDLLDAAFRQRLLMSFRLLRERYGYEMVLIEGYRGPERQAMLAALGPSVTRAGPFESYHQFGLAADCAFVRDGHIVISEKDPWAMAGYERYGQVAKSLGLAWGGDWRALRDLGHVELHRPRDLPAARVDRARLDLDT